MVKGMKNIKNEFEKVECTYCGGYGRTPTDIWSETSATWQPCQCCCEKERTDFYNSTEEEMINWFNNE